MKNSVQLHTEMSDHDTLLSIAHKTLFKRTNTTRFNKTVCYAEENNDATWNFIGLSFAQLNKMVMSPANIAQKHMAKYWLKLLQLQCENEKIIMPKERLFEAVFPSENMQH